MPRVPPSRSPGRTLFALADLLRRTGRRFQARQGSLLSAALAFYMLLAVVPLLLLTLAAFGFVMGAGDARVELERYITEFFPPGGRRVLLEAVDAAIAHRGSTGIAGLLGLAIAATAGINTLEAAVNRLWDCPSRGMVRGRLFSLGMLLLLCLLLGLNSGLGALLLAAGQLPWLGWLAHSAVLRALASLGTLLTGCAVFVLVYRWFPNRPGGVPRGAAVAAGTAAGLAWEALKRLYAAWVAWAGAGSASYGTLAGMVGLFLWVYYSSSLMLFAAALAREIVEPALPDE